MFGFSLATQIFQGSTVRTWNCVTNFANLVWTKFSHIRHFTMPRSRKRHHSRSRSRSRSNSHDRSHERHRKGDSHEKDGKKRKIDSADSPHLVIKRSVSSERSFIEAEEQVQTTVNNEPKEAIKRNDHNGQAEDISDIKAENNTHDSSDIKSDLENSKNESVITLDHSDSKDTPLKKEELKNTPKKPATPKQVQTKLNFGKKPKQNSEETVQKKEQTDKTQSNKEAKFKAKAAIEELTPKKVESKLISEKNINEQKKSEETFDKKENDSKTEIQEKSDIKIVAEEEKMDVSDNSIDVLGDSNPLGITLKKEELKTTPRKTLTPNKIKKKLESEKKRQEKQKEREEREKKNKEKERIKQEKLKQKQKELEEKQKEKEMKEAHKRKEKEEKEQKRKEKEEKEEQKRKERELEKLKKQQEIDEKNKEKQKEEEKKQKTAAAFVNFFVPKKTDVVQEDKKTKEKTHSNFMPFEVKTDMKLPPNRREPLSEEAKIKLEEVMQYPDESASYLKDIKSGKPLGKSFKTWPFVENVEDDDVTLIEEESNLGETIYGGTSKVQTIRAKYLQFHENRRPAYFGTWRKKSKHINPRRPFAEDSDIFNYEEDSDDDWEEEEQGESLDVSDDETEKENDEKDDYEVDNEFFVPHGHLSDDEVDDEENARLSPESLKQKLKLLKDEFEEDIKSKTHKLKPRSIGCVWYNKEGTNVEDAIKRYLQPFAVLTNGQIIIKNRNEIFNNNVPNRKKSTKPSQELNADHMPMFLKIVHGNFNKKKTLAEEFLTYMTNNGFTVDVSKASLIKTLKQMATWKRCKENGPLKNKFCWVVHDDVKEKFTVDLALKKNS